MPTSRYRCSPIFAFQSAQGATRGACGNADCRRLLHFWVPESREKTPEKVNQRRRDGEHSRRCPGGRDDCIDRQGGRRVGTDDQEIRDDEPPLARATNEEAAGERDHSDKRFNDKLPVRQLRELAQATPHGRDDVRVAPRQARPQQPLLHSCSATSDASEERWSESATAGDVRGFSYLAPVSASLEPQLDFDEAGLGGSRRDRQERAQ